ncbi:flagellar basal body rod protein FlgC [Nitratidesulfovibrio sp. SRB-5]|uniref:flagellar basal body rod protein FlgC n=1 Tax=Nitratidesulfovibrio sp. SRB-5 TaxID=2872636 RepID=UPI0010279926|nr:flagellar basal body rod C-terminal domain-containing protein [Nitratidesulfovibrio sp. SRB-5]MBZ2172521.1 flagellar basal body protein [Nitratidesulfovibrio sp. SRB-5]RXF76058.1 flagellar biosynthesis protein FlgG [Desulfovibrio sp. DS-1]
MIDGFGTPLSALDAFGTSMAVTANNVANMNTDEFRASDVRLQTGPASQNGQDGQERGVQVAEIRQSTTEGPLRMDLRRVVHADGSVTVETGAIEGSNTDVANEMVSMLTDQRAFEANAAVVRARDEMTGILVDRFV